MPESSKNKNSKLIAKFRQFYGGEEANVKERYCLLLLSEKKKKLLLSGNKSAFDKVQMVLFEKGLLLIGNGLRHEIEFLEEKDLVGQYKAYQLTI